MERKPSRIYRHLVIEYNVTSAGRADQIPRCECFRRIWGATLAGLAFSPFHPFILGTHDHPGHHRLGIITGRGGWSMSKQKPSVEASFSPISFLGQHNSKAGISWLRSPSFSDLGEIRSANSWYVERTSFNSIYYICNLTI